MKLSENIKIDDMLNILIISPFYPTIGNEYIPIFITKRAEILKKSMSFKIVSVIPQNSFFLGILLNIFYKKRNVSDSLIHYDNNVKYNYVYYKRGIIYLFAKKIDPTFQQKIYSRAIEKQININNYDIIHSHWVYPEGTVGLILSKKFEIPHIITAHGSDIHTIPQKSKFLKLVTKCTLESTDKVIFVSMGLLNAAKKIGFKETNSVVIPNGVSTNKFLPIGRKKSNEEFQFEDDNVKCVGFVGNLVSVKRVDKLPIIFQFINERIEKVKFIIVGDGNLRKIIENEIKNNQIEVYFSGIVHPNKVPYYMNLLDCLILPSRNEGWPCVVLEAQACGVPVVGSSAGGIPEAVGDGGLIVEEGDRFEERFAEAVCKVLDNPPESETLRKRALKYDWEKTVEREIEVYRSILR